jgi:hypothetical protein
MEQKPVDNKGTELVVPDIKLPATLQGYATGDEVKSEVLSIKDKEAFYIKVVKPITMKKIKDVYNGGLVDRPFIEAVDLETGEEGLIILPTVLCSIFTKLGQDAVGRAYAVQALGRGGKTYNQYKVVELKPMKKVN